MTVLIKCDRCELKLTMDIWQHRIDGKIYCHDCYENSQTIRMRYKI